MERVSKINYYLDIAETVSQRSTCLRRRFGAIIVKNDVIEKIKDKITRYVKKETGKNPLILPNILEID